MGKRQSVEISLVDETRLEVFSYFRKVQQKAELSGYAAASAHWLYDH